MPTALEHDNAARIETVFRKHDGDNSGTISATELAPALAELGVDVGALDATVYCLSPS